MIQYLEDINFFCLLIDSVEILADGIQMNGRKPRWSGEGSWESSGIVKHKATTEQEAGSYQASFVFVGHIKLQKIH